MTNTVTQPVGGGSAGRRGHKSSQHHTGSADRLFMAALGNGSFNLGLIIVLLAGIAVTFGVLLLISPHQPAPVTPATKSAVQQNPNLDPVLQRILNG